MIALPLSRDLNRCHANGYMAGSTCERAEHCARHITLQYDKENVPAAFRACSSELMVMYIPVEGWPDRDAEEA